MMLKELLATLYRRLPLAIQNRVETLRNLLTVGGRYRIRPTDPSGMRVFQLTDKTGETIHICRLGRRRLYRRGIMRRINDLARAYCLDELGVTPGGIFIDCGANVGEMGFWARAHDLEYVAFEPELPEAICCDLNNFGGSPLTRRTALWKETTKLPLYSRPESASSSLIEVGCESRQVKVSGVTLDSVIDLSQLSEASGTIIFKVEAEGAEPEVLEGASRTLAQIDWVAIDCGYERGAERAHTFVETNTFMQDCGFRLRRAEFRRGTALYRNMVK